MRLLRRLLYWAANGLRCLAHRLDRVADWTCGEQDMHELARLVQAESLKRLGVAITDEVVDLIVRFHKAAERLKDQIPGFAESYLISKLFGVLPIEARRQVVTELEREVDLAPNPQPSTEDKL